MPDAEGRLTLLKTLLLLRMPVSEWTLDARVYATAALYSLVERTPVPVMLDN